VLIVDDDTMKPKRWQLTFWFKATKCRIELGGRHVIKLATAWQPELIIYRYFDAGDRRLEATLALRRDLGAGNTMVVAICALDEADVRAHLSHPLSTSIAEGPTDVFVSSDAQVDH
jgi:hypothetical protein